MGALGLQKKLHVVGTEVTVNEAKGMIGGYFTAYPGVAKYLRDISIQGLKKLELKSLSGRLIKFEYPRTKKQRSSIMRESKNLPIQLLCADMIKIAMANIFLQLELKGVKFINTVHDELVFECTEAKPDEARCIVKEDMEKAGSLFLKDVPCIVEVKVSDTWEK
jgi:DNA polymerase I-like protein with 3'-5' exonuclease and polymerase domains